MKKTTSILFLCIFFATASTFAQKFSLGKYAKEASESGNGMSPVVYKAKNLVVDESNGYVFQYTTAIYEDKGNNIFEKNEYYTSWGVWNGIKKKIIGSFSINLDPRGNVSVGIDGNLGINFVVEKGTLGNIYDEKQVKDAFQKSLDQIQAKGGEGTELFYAEFPQKGTSIGLFMALGSEINKNKGIPKWKMQFGELKFDKNTERFIFIKK